MHCLQPEGASRLNTGDKVLVFIVQPESQEGQIILSLDRARGERGWRVLQEYMDQNQSFEGYVTGVSAFGLYIELIEHFVEGMVHVSTMADDYYRFVDRAHLLRGERNGRVYRLGDRVRVQVIRVDLEKRLIDLGLSEILDAVRTSDRHHGPHRGRTSKKDERDRQRGKRPVPSQRVFGKAARRRRR